MTEGQAEHFRDSTTIELNIRRVASRKANRNKPDACLRPDLESQPFSTRRQISLPGGVAALEQDLWMNLVFLLYQHQISDPSVPFAQARAFISRLNCRRPLNGPLNGDGGQRNHRRALAIPMRRCFLLRERGKIQQRHEQLRAMSPRALADEVHSVAASRGSNPLVYYGNSWTSTLVEVARFAACLGGERVAGLADAVLLHPDTYMKKGAADLVFYRADILDEYENDGGSGGGNRDRRSKHDLARPPVVDLNKELYQDMSKQCYSFLRDNPADHATASKAITSRIFLEDNVFVAEVKVPTIKGATQRQWAELLVDIGVCSFLFKVNNTECQVS